ITAECDRAALAGSREEYALALQLGRQPLVVGIEKGDRFAAARPNARIARGGGPAIALVAQDAQTRVREPLKRALKVVGGSVVDNDQLEIAEALAQHRAHRPGDRP